MNYLTLPGGIVTPSDPQLDAGDTFESASCEQRSHSSAPLANDDNDGDVGNALVTCDSDAGSRALSMLNTASALMRMERSEVRVTEFDMYAALPRMDLWGTLHMHKRRAREHVRKLVYRFLCERQRERQQRLSAIDVEVVREMQNVSSLRVVSGASVNIVALSSYAPPQCHQIGMQELLYGRGNGYIVATRQRNSASRVCITPPTPVVSRDESVNHLLEVQNERIEAHLRRTYDGKKVCTSAIDKERERLALESKRGYDLFRCTDMCGTRNMRNFGNNQSLLTGAEDPHTALYSMLQQAWLLACEGSDITHLQEFSTQNVVSCFRLPHTVNLEEMRKSHLCDNTQILKRDFPAVIYPPDEECISKAYKLADRVKQLRRDIVTSTEWQSARERRANNFVVASVRSHEWSLVEAQHVRNAMGVTDTSRDSGGSGSAANHNSTSEHFNDTVLNMTRGASRDKKRRENIEFIVYESGAQVITGPKDQDVEAALYDINCDSIAEVTAMERLRKRRQRARTEERKRKRANNNTARSEERSLSLRERDYKLVHANAPSTYGRALSTAISNIGEARATSVASSKGALRKSNAVRRREATVALGRHTEDATAPHIEREYQRASKRQRGASHGSAILYKPGAADGTDSRQCVRRDSTAVCTRNAAQYDPDSIEHFLDGISESAQ